MWRQGYAQRGFYSHRASAYARVSAGLQRIALVTTNIRRLALHLVQFNFFTLIDLHRLGSLYSSNSPVDPTTHNTPPTSSVATMSYDEQRFSELIYNILRESDLETVSAKRIRTALQDKLGYDVSDHKVSPSIHL